MFVKKRKRNALMHEKWGKMGKNGGAGGGGGGGAYIRNNIFVSANGWAYIRGALT